MNKMHPAVAVALLVTGSFIAIKGIASLFTLTKAPEAPKAIAHDNSATPPVAPTQQIAEPAAAASGTASAA